MPPSGVVIAPWLMIVPSLTPGPSPEGRGELEEVKLSLPARKSSLDRLSVEATSPATSMRAPCPTRMPDGLMRKTLPFDVSVPSSCEGSAPMTRLSTELAADCWMKLVVSFWLMLKPCQLMMALGLLVMVRVLPSWLIAAVPWTISAPIGLAWAWMLKQRVTARANGLIRNLLLRRVGLLM